MKKGLTWVLRYRINGAEQTPLVVGLVEDFPTEDDASLEADRLGLRVRINSGNSQVGRIRFNELAEYYLKVEFDPEVTASPKSENTKPILQHHVRDILIAKWGGQIADNIEPLEIQRWFNRLHNKKDYGWTTVSKIRGIMNRIFKIGIIHKKVSKNPVEGLATSSKTAYKAIKITPAQTLLILRSVIGNILHFTLVFVVAATALRSSEVLSLRWADILWEERKIRIAKSRKKTGVDGSTKTPSSEPTTDGQGVDPLLARMAQTNAVRQGHGFRVPVDKGERQSTDLLVGILRRPLAPCGKSSRRNHPRRASLGSAQPPTQPV
jgi:hypothetical protein